MSWTITVSPKARRGFARLNESDQEELAYVLGELPGNPRLDGLLYDVVELDLHRNSYRVKTGRLRIVYRVSKSQERINVTVIGVRSSKTYERYNPEQDNSKIPVAVRRVNILIPAGGLRIIG